MVDGKNSYCSYIRRCTTWLDWYISILNNFLNTRSSLLKSLTNKLFGMKTGIYIYTCLYIYNTKKQLVFVTFTKFQRLTRIFRKKKYIA